MLRTLYYASLLRCARYVDCYVARYVARHAARTTLCALLRTRYVARYVTRALLLVMLRAMFRAWRLLIVSTGSLISSYASRVPGTVRYHLIVRRAL